MWWRRVFRASVGWGASLPWEIDCLTVQTDMFVGLGFVYPRQWEPTSFKGGRLLLFGRCCFCPARTGVAVLERELKQQALLLGLLGGTRTRRGAALIATSRGESIEMLVVG
ncbi:unnamed protein product, partial [Ectocarpus sp. 12 AP-2014]